MFCFENVMRLYEVRNTTKNMAHAKRKNLLVENFVEMLNE